MIELDVTPAMALALREQLPLGAWSTWPTGIDRVRLTLTPESADRVVDDLVALLARVGMRDYK